ncbi:MAG: exodeoxyribonuclease VII small subunit [Lachnospiraceae bacterium]|nr:exodeoxyribonuclease VII small subunit [Lachnospiraceae bacterium]
MSEENVKTDNLSMEQHLNEIEALIAKLEDRNISIEDSFAYYKAGMEHIAACNSLMDAVEKKVKVLNEQGDLVDFQEV